ncbi:MAG TPA: DAK2 domain-containing protein [Chloroflexia bacterium]|nr:DAK2 domain-containing protein [Chloroflexia bacterium]
MAEAQAIDGQAVVEAMRRAGSALKEQVDYLTSLDQALGDGDMGITVSRIADALQEYVDTNPAPDTDIGKFLASAGMAVNRAASSTMGTLTATALMRAGKEVAGKAQLMGEDLAAMLRAADTGIQERGKAKPGDKTIVDALHPAQEAFSEAIAAGASVHEAARKALQAAEEGRDHVTPLRSRVGRASWVGERTEGQVDPGCAALVILLQALAR